MNTIYVGPVACSRLKFQKLSQDQSGASQTIWLIVSSRLNQSETCFKFKDLRKKVYAATIAHTFHLLVKQYWETLIK